MTPNLDICRWCGGGHPIEKCREVLAAFVPGYSFAVDDSGRDPLAYRPERRPNPKKMAGLCARPGCDAPRWHKTPYCHPHRLEVTRASDAKNVRIRRKVTP